MTSLIVLNDTSRDSVITPVVRDIGLTQTEINSDESANGGVIITTPITYTNSHNDPYIKTISLAFSHCVSILTFSFLVYAINYELKSNNEKIKGLDESCTELKPYITTNIVFDIYYTAFGLFMYGLSTLATSSESSLKHRWIPVIMTFIIFLWTKAIIIFYTLYCVMSLSEKCSREYEQSAPSILLCYKVNMFCSMCSVFVLIFGNGTLQLYGINVIPFANAVNSTHIKSAHCDFTMKKCDLDATNCDIESRVNSPSHTSCTICMETYDELVVCDPCGHACICADCYNKLPCSQFETGTTVAKPCPICREPIAKLLKVYLS